MGKIKKSVFMAFACIVFILGIAIIIFWNSVFNIILSRNLKLTEGTQTEKTWSQNLVPVTFKVYMFNWTNPKNTLAKLEKPNFVEMGPYTFKFVQLKSGIVWHTNNTLTFDGDRVWTFEPDKSNGSLSDLITNINTVAISVGERARNMYWLEKKIINKALQYFEKNVYITKTVRELLFDGYNDQILNIARFLKQFHIDLGFLPEKFGWYFKKNVTEIDTFNIHTGEDDINILGKIHSWNYNTKSGVYYGSCDQVHGSLGDLWPMNIKEKKTASLFISDFCGAFDLFQVKEKRLQGLNAVQFDGTEETFDNGSKYTKNLCYCKNSKCTSSPSGVRDVSNCVHGPIFVSFPHFYAADKTYLRNLNGLKPEAEKHKFSVSMQKDSGLVMEVFARLQVNVNVKKNSDLNFFKKLPIMVYPTIWFEESVELPDFLINQFTLFFSYVPEWLPIIGYVLLVIGIVFILIGGFLFYGDLPLLGGNNAYTQID